MFYKGEIQTYNKMGQEERETQLGIKENGNKKKKDSICKWRELGEIWEDYGNKVTRVA